MELFSILRFLEIKMHCCPGHLSKCLFLDKPKKGFIFLSMRGNFSKSVLLSFRCSCINHVLFLFVFLNSSVRPMTHSLLCSLHSCLAEECQADAESFLVPIAVGVALLVLILIVLLAYFIGRKRNMATGYESF